MSTMDAYREGQAAAAAYLQFWENPYAVQGALQSNFHGWFAGWCYGKQQRRDAERKMFAEIFEQPHESKDSDQ